MSADPIVPRGARLPPATEQTTYPTIAEHNSSALPTIGVDIGGTNIKAVVLSSGTIRHHTRRATHPHEGHEAVVQRVGAIINELNDAARSEGSIVASVGLGVPGLVDATEGRSVHSTNLGWSNAKLASPLTAATGLPVHVENDVYLGALAEATLGAARGEPAALFIAIGTGIAATCIGTKGTWRGTSGFAGELGDMRVPNRVEDSVSAQGLSAIYHRMTGSHKPPHLIAADASTDGPSWDAWSSFCDQLALATWNAITLLDPSMVVFGGGIAGAGPDLVQPVSRSLSALAPHFRTLPPLAIAQFGPFAGAVGAAIHTHRNPES